MSNQVFHVFQAMKDTPPPAPSLRFRSVRSIKAEIADLERLLGLPASKMPLELAAINTRVFDLRAQLASHQAAATAADAAPAAKSPAAVRMEEYLKISDPFLKTAYYRKHTAELDLAWLEQAKTPAPASPSCGEPIIDHYRALASGIDRVQWYSKFPEEMDSAYRRLNSATS